MPHITKAFDHVGIIGTFVDGASQGRGISKKLFTSTFEIAKQKEYEKLFAYVRSGNNRALTAYLKQGLEVVGTAKNHANVGGVYIDEILIENFYKTKTRTNNYPEAILIKNTTLFNNLILLGCSKTTEIELLQTQKSR